MPVTFSSMHAHTHPLAGAHVLTNKDNTSGVSESGRWLLKAQAMTLACFFACKVRQDFFTVVLAVFRIASGTGKVGGLACVFNCTSTLTVEDSKRFFKVKSLALLAY